MKTITPPVALVLLSLSLASCKSTSNQTGDDLADRARRGCAHTETSFHCVEYLENYDGDTVLVNLPTIHPLFGRRIHVRIRGIDAPELRGDGQCEQERAQEAKAMVREILTASRARLHVEEIKRDKYFRVLGNLRKGDVFIGDELIRRHVAIKYDGEAKPTVDWCVKPPRITQP